MAEIAPPQPTQLHGSILYAPLWRSLALNAARLLPSLFVVTDSLASPHVSDSGLSYPISPMPIRLGAGEIVDSVMAGRLIFVIGATEPLVCTDAALADGNLFGRGLRNVFGNYLSAFHIRGGLAALCDDATFLRATRALADDIYAAGLGAHDVVVDASEHNTETPQVIEALFPDAEFVVVDGPVGPPPAAALLRSERITTVTPDGVADAVTAALARLRAASPSPSCAPRAPAELVAPPIFVVGCPRSGTTWLQRMLGAHGAIGGPERETALFVSLRELWQNERIAEWIGRVALDAAIRRYATDLLARAVTAPATRVLEKTPLHAHHLDFIVAMFPDAAIIGIHRDGRDVIRSLLEVEFGSEEPIDAVEWWVSTTQLVEQFTRAHPRTARSEEYELLLADPIGVTSDVLTWLGHPPDDEARAELRARVDERVSQYNTTGKVGSGKWQDLPPATVRMIYRRAGERLVSMGYITREELTAERYKPAYVLDRLMRRT